MTQESIKRFDTAAKCTGVRIRRLLLNLPDNIKSQAQEIRLRCGRPIMVCGLFGDVFVNDVGRESYILSSSAVKATISDVEDCFKIICGYSVHTHQSSICNGYVTVQGGHRAGIAGTAVNLNGEINAIREVSSINIRIARQFKGIAEELLAFISSLDRKSVIIAGAPSSGKTTVLRDLARLLSSAEGGFQKTVIIDEREEIAACFNSVPQNDVGISSDVLTGYRKSEGVTIALRSMSPQNIVIDEITTLEEAGKIESGLNSGVNFYLTAHACDRYELMRRKPVRHLLETGEFGAVAFLDNKENPSKIKEFILAGDLSDENSRCNIDSFSSACGRLLCGNTC